MSQRTFWRLSQVELRREFQGAQQRRAGWHELGLWIAWHTANFTRAKDLPALQPLLEKLRRGSQGARPQTPNQQATMLKVIAEQYGLSLRINGTIAIPARKAAARPVKRPAATRKGR